MLHFDERISQKKKNISHKKSTTPVATFTIRVLAIPSPASAYDQTIV